MTVEGLLKMIQKLQKTGPFDMLSGRGRKRIDLTVVEEVVSNPAVHGEFSEHWIGL